MGMRKYLNNREGDANSMFGDELLVVLILLGCKCAGDVPEKKVLSFTREWEVCVPTGDQYGESH